MGVEQTSASTLNVAVASKHASLQVVVFVMVYVLFTKRALEPE